MDDDIDALRAEAEYFRQRELELKEDLSRNARALGIPAITDENVTNVLDGVIGALRRSGNGALARDFESAFCTFMAASNRSRAATEAGHVDHAARTAMNDACERFESVDAEVSTWLDNWIKRGGA
jgi:hypothetical protein